MKKRYALIIPHLLGLATVLLFVAMGFSGTGNMLTDFIALGAAIFYTIYFLPFSSAVSALIVVARASQELGTIRWRRFWRRLRLARRAELPRYIS